jgi:hypothetical protein
VRLEGLGQLKNPMTSLGIEPAIPVFKRGENSSCLRSRGRCDRLEDIYDYEKNGLWQTQNFHIPFNLKPHATSDNKETNLATVLLRQSKAVLVKDLGSPQGCESSRHPHVLDNRLTDGGEAVSLTRRPPKTPQEVSSYSVVRG